MGEILEQNLPSRVDSVLALEISARVFHCAAIAFVTNIDVVRGGNSV